MQQIISIYGSSSTTRNPKSMRESLRPIRIPRPRPVCRALRDGEAGCSRGWFIILPDTFLPLITRRTAFSGHLRLRRWSATDRRTGRSITIIGTTQHGRTPRFAGFLTGVVRKATCPLAEVGRTTGDIIPAIFSATVHTITVRLDVTNPGLRCAAGLRCHFPAERMRIEMRKCLDWMAGS